jgi:hypothetical protein
MTYADADVVTTMVKLGTNVLNDSLIQLALNYGDNCIFAQIPEMDIPTPTPQVIVDAANLYAAVNLLDIYYQSSDIRNPTAKAFETNANSMMAGFIEEYGNVGHKLYTRNNSCKDRPFKGSWTQDKRYKRDGALGRWPEG